MGYTSSVRIVMRRDAWEPFNEFVEQYLYEHVNPKVDDFNIVKYDLDVRYIGSDEIYIGWNDVRWDEESGVYGVDAVMYALDKLCDDEYAVAYTRVGEELEDEDSWNHQGKDGKVELPTADITFDDDYFMSDSKGIRQVKIRNLDDGSIHGAILLPSGGAICGCCGSVLPADECLNSPTIRNADEATWEVLEELPWINLDDAILGDDTEE